LKIRTPKLCLKPHSTLAFLTFFALEGLGIFLPAHAKNFKFGMEVACNNKSKKLCLINNGVDHRKKKEKPVNRLLILVL